jgi:hypothetical protein
MTTESKDNTNTTSNDMFKLLGRPFQEKVIQALVSDRMWAAGFVDLFEIDKRRILLFDSRDSSVRRRMGMK